MKADPAKKLGKLSLAILENLVKSKIGGDAVDILRGDYQNSQTIAQALQRTEDRFIHQYKDKQLSKAMFVDLKQADRVPLKDALIQYLDQPTDPQFEQSICAILLGEFKDVISNERIQNAVRFYLEILNEELIILDGSFREKLVALKILRDNQGKFYSVEQAKRVELIIEGEPSDFDPNRQQEVVGVLAALLHIEQSQIRVLHVRAGSIILDLEIPEIGANRLIDLFKSHDYRLKRLGYLQVQFEGNVYKVSNVRLPINSSLRLGKLSLTILENFVHSRLGEKFIRELPGDNTESMNFVKALENAEKRFLKEFEDKDLAQAMFVELAEKDRPELQNGAIEFYQHPSRSSFKKVLSDVLLGEFKTLSQERVEPATSTYVAILTEELAMLDPEFREKVSFLTTFREPEKVINMESKGSYQIPPLPPQGVFGREDAINKVANLLELNDMAIQNISPFALRGMGGIGKTTLAIAFAHKYAAKFEDGVLWTSLGPKPTPRLLLDAWGRSLGLDLLPERDEAACQNRLRQFLHDKHVLVIIDDVWDTIQGRYFLIGGPYCRTIITTRELPIANDLATRERVLRVDVLNPEAALALLQKLAPETVLVDRGISIRLCERLEFLPLAITLAGRMLANEADVPQRMQRLLGELIERRDSRLQLLQAEGRPGLEEEKPVSLQAILGMSVDRLDRTDQERFAMLSIFGGEPLTWELNAVSAVWETPMEETEATIARFIQRGLVEPRDGRYWMHALLADYAGELIEQMGL